jgi:hypothetical protein
MELRTQVMIIIVAIIVTASVICGFYLYKEWTTPKEIYKHYTESNITLNPDARINLEFYSKPSGRITGNISAQNGISIYILSAQSFFLLGQSTNFSGVKIEQLYNGTFITIQWDVPYENYWYVVLHNPENQTTVVSYDVWCRYLS